MILLQPFYELTAEKVADVRVSLETAPVAEEILRTLFTFQPQTEFPFDRGFMFLAPRQPAVLFLMIAAAVAAQVLLADHSDSFLIQLQKGSLALC